MSKPSKKMHWIGQRLFLHASPRRAVVESLVAGLAFVLFILQPRYAGEVQNEGFTALVSGCVMICALHMRLATGRWWQQMLREGLAALTLSIPWPGWRCSMD